MSSDEPVVFLIDDDLAVRHALRRVVRSRGIPIETFPSAEEFLERGVTGARGCIVLDLRLPGLNGLALQEKLASLECDMSIVFISGHGDIPTTVKAMRKGAIDFLPKPFDDTDLLEAIIRAFSRQEAQRSEQEAIQEQFARIEELTPREKEVFHLVVKGLMNKQIAAVLGIAEKTVKIHRARVMAKTGSVSLADLVRLGERIGA